MTSPTEVIATPKGGGALQGIGEKFSPDLYTGTGNFTIPIALPAGRNGFNPQISLAYSTGNGNGPFGLGWSLSVPGVSRKTSKGVPRYDDSRDVFILSGSEDLVPIGSPGPGITQYRPRTEGLFARIFHHRHSSNDFWEVKTKDGLTSFYGTAAQSGTDGAAIADPEDKARVFAWKLTQTTDPFGNVIEYVYERMSIRLRGFTTGINSIFPPYVTLISVIASIRTSSSRSTLSMATGQIIFPITDGAWKFVRSSATEIGGTVMEPS